MWHLIMLFFFGNPISLSSENAAITSTCTDIALKAPLKVRGPQAVLIVRLPYAPEDHWPTDVAQQLERVKNEYPPNRINATFVDLTGHSVVTSIRGRGAANDNFELWLDPTEGFKNGEEFSKVSICANPAVASAHILWRQIGE